MKQADIDKLEKMVEEEHRKFHPEGFSVLDAWNKVIKPHLLSSEHEGSKLAQDILFKHFNAKSNVEFQEQLTYQSMRREIILSAMEEYAQSKLSHMTALAEAAERVIEQAQSILTVSRDKERWEAYQSWQSLKSNSPEVEGPSDEYYNQLTKHTNWSGTDQKLKDGRGPDWKPPIAEEEGKEDVSIDKLEELYLEYTAEELGEYGKDMMDKFWNKQLRPLLEKKIKAK